MEDLRGRFRRLLSTHTDALRHLEHKTFNRLLYRNRQQHRHGLYFHRLEHVRRLLRKITSHMVWNSVQHALGEDDSKAHSKRKAPLALSTVTVQDLQSVEALLKVLVGQVIPATAVRVTTELICRQHFIPFAVAIVACLARIFVIERKLVAEVRGALVEAKLLLGISNDQSGPQQQIVGMQGSIEDIGEEVESAAAGMRDADNVGDKVENRVACGKREKPRKPRIYESENALLRPLKRQRIPADKVSARTNEAEAPSLYAVMALYSKGAVSVAESTTMSTGGNLTNVASEIVRGAENGVAQNKVKKETFEVEEKNAVGDMVRCKPQKDLDLSGSHVDGTEPSPGTDSCIATNPCRQSGSSSSSDSEDIDDIFGALAN